MVDTRVVLPACPCPIRARLRRLAPSYTFTGCLLPQAYGKGDTARNEDEYRVQASPTTPAKLLMLTQGVGVLKEGRCLNYTMKLPQQRGIFMVPIVIDSGSDAKITAPMNPWNKLWV